VKRSALSIGVAAVMAISSSGVFAATANTNQKGSLLIFPKIEVDTLRQSGPATKTTWIRLVNDGRVGVQVKCYFMDENKTRNDFEFRLTRNQSLTFDAETGQAYPAGAQSVGTFPAGQTDHGELVCFTVVQDGTNLINYNNLSGTATISNGYVNSAGGGVTEYNAWSFKAIAATPTGDLDLNNVEYDICPAYLMGLFSPKGSVAPGGERYEGTYGDTYVNFSSCKQDLRQDYDYNYTKLQYDVWKWDEVKLTGAYSCSNSFFEGALEKTLMQPQQFTLARLGGPGYYRVQGMKSTQCTDSQNVGLLGIQTSIINSGVAPDITPVGAVSAEMTASNDVTVGDAIGFVKWDPDNGRNIKP